MNKIPFYIVNAFTGDGLLGNPAGVCIIHDKLSKTQMQTIAAKNNLPETAFIQKTNNGYSLRWFTPAFEIDLCGHATLASAYIVFSQLEPEASTVNFHTMSGSISVIRQKDLFEISFPVRKGVPIQSTDNISAALGFSPKEIYANRDLYILMDKEDDIKSYIPNYHKLSTLTDWLGIVITARGNNCDFVSRYFCPELQDEDPVTGSSHCTLVPLWADKLGKTSLTARQLSPRGGELICELMDDTVVIKGHAKLEYSGEL